MRLYDLPPELISQILNGERSNAAITLWLTGNRLIATKLANKGIVDVELKCESDQYPTVWPQCLSSFKLHSLVIECLERSNLSLDQLRSGISQLPNTLLRLEVHHHGAYEAIFGDTIIVGDYGLDTGYRRSKQPRLEDDSYPELNFKECCNLSSTLDKIERLKLVASPDEECHLTAHATSLLPASLTSLDVITLRLHKSANYALQLPNLIELAAHNILVLDLFRLLPRSITSLRSESYQSSCLKVLSKDYASILPNLTDVQLPQMMLRPDVYQRDDGTWPPFPRKLHFTSLSKDQKLPPNLTSLSIFSIPNWDSFSTTLLPDKITTLELSDLPWNSITSNSWPRSLTSLTFEFDLNFNQMHFHRLPRTLLDFKCMIVSEDAPLTDFDFDAATASGKLMLDGPEKQSWSAHKQELILTGNRNGGRLMRKIGRYIDAVERGELFGLPLSLTSTYLCALTEYYDARLLLPPKLHSLVTKPVAGIGRSEFWELLPPTVTSVRLFDVDYLYHLYFDDDLLPSEFALFHQSALSALTIDASLSHVSSSLIQLLPRSLPMLSITTPLEYLKDLPPTLTKLCVHCIGESDTTDWISRLPRTLTHIDLTAVNISGDELQQLPLNLEYLRCNVISTTLDHLLSMPCQSLRTMDSRSVELNRSDESLLLSSEIKMLSAQFRPFWRLFRTSKADLQELIDRMREPCAFQSETWDS